MRKYWTTLTAALLVLLLPAFSIADSASKATLVTSVDGDVITLDVPVSAISLSFPKGGFKPVQEERAGSQVHPRYFYFSDNARSIAVSGWIESASQFQGFDKFWLGEFAAMKKSGIVPKAAPTMVKAGEWVAAAYDVDISRADTGAVNSHVRAELLKEGTWVDLHISVTGKAPSSEARAVALEFLNSIAIRKK